MSLPWDTPPPAPLNSPQVAPPIRENRHVLPELPLPGMPEFEPQIGSRDEDNVDGTWADEFRESAAWFTKGFWAATFVRAVRTFAQTMVATATAAGVGVPLHWYECALTSAGAAGLSVLMSIDRNMRS